MVITKIKFASKIKILPEGPLRYSNNWSILKRAEKSQMSKCTICSSVEVVVKHYSESSKQTGLPRAKIGPPRLLLEYRNDHFPYKVVSYCKVNYNLENCLRLLYGKNNVYVTCSTDVTTEDTL